MRRRLIRYRELTILKAPITLLGVVMVVETADGGTTPTTADTEAAAGHEAKAAANNAVSLDNLLSPVSISICDIGDDDDAVSKSNNCKSSKATTEGGDVVPRGTLFLLPVSSLSWRSPCCSVDPFSARLTGDDEENGVS